MIQVKKPIVLGTGLTGLVGSRIVKLLSNQYDWINLDIAHPTQPVDITNVDSIRQVVSKHNSSALLHCAAFTDVTGAWQQTDNKDGLCYQVNVLGTQNIAQVCQEQNIHLIHLSTAYVFDGQKETAYVESDLPHPIEWYGQTKLWSEEAIQKIQPTFTILRIDQPFRPDAFPRLDAVHRIIAGLKNNTLYPQFSDHTFGPTYIDSLASIIDQVMKKRITGLYHATNNESWTDLDFSKEISRLINYPGEIQVGSLYDYLKTINRPYQANTALNSSQLWKILGTPPMSIRQALLKTIESSFTSPI